MRGARLIPALCLALWGVGWGQQQNILQSQNASAERPAAMVTIRGGVYLPGGNPVERNVRLTIRLTTQVVVRETFTDSSGSFEVKGLNSNTSYELVVWGDDDYETTVERVDAFGDRSYTENRDIYLRRKSPVGKRNPKPGLVSILELSASIPKAARKAYERGLKEAQKERHQQAVVHFRRAIEKYDRFFQAYNELGRQYLWLNRLEEAGEAFAQAMSLEPRRPHPYLSLGIVRMRQQRYGEAIPRLKRALDLDGTSWRGQMWLAVCLMAVGEDLFEAKHRLEKAILFSHPPDGSIARLYLANLYIRQGRLNQALEQAEIYLQEVPEAENAQQVRDHMAEIRVRMQRSSDPP